MAMTQQDSSKNVELEHDERLSSLRRSQDPYSEERIEEPFKLTFKLFLAFLSLQIGYMADVFVTGMAETDFSYINSAIGPSPNNYAWLVASVNLAGSVMNPVVARLSDVFGRKVFLLTGNLLGIVGCAMSARCKSMSVLIGAGALIGLSSAAHSLALTCIAEMVPRRSRPLAQGLFQGSLIAASAFSPLIAHAFVLNTSWRDIYWLAFAHNIAGFVFVAFFYHPEKQNITEKLEPIWERCKKFDWPGSFLYVTMLTIFACGLLFGGGKYPWISAGTMAPVFVGVALMFTFAIWEFFNSKTELALLPRPLVRKLRTFDVILATMFLSGLLNATAILWPEEIQILFTQKPIRMGLFGMASGLPGAIFAPLVGYVVTRGYHRWWLIFFSIAYTIVVGAQATISPSSAASSTVLVAFTGAFYTAVFVIGIGMIQMVVRHEHLGIATGLAISLHTYGGAMDSIIVPIMLKNKLSAQVKERLPPILVRAGIPLRNLQAAIEALLGGEVTSPALAGASPLGLLEAGQVLKSCYAHAFRYVYEVSITFGILAICFAVFSKDLKKYMSPMVEVRLMKSKGLLPPDVEALANRAKSGSDEKRGNGASTGNGGL
ncbi:MAG: hypothetical protein M1818_004507 [Claussenomyces sp. TS43310]|nr:MAG: hypothetical protein M1818_004507 [Claussenomyces sp. TS43310]